MTTDTITLRELTIRYSLKADATGQPLLIGRTLSTPATSAAALTALLQDEPGEVFAILCLSTKRRVIAYHEVSRGTLDATLVHPREVFKAALLATPQRSCLLTTIRAVIQHRAQTTWHSRSDWLRLGS